MIEPALTPGENMKKIPTVFMRDPENMSRLLNEPHPDCAWVFAGEGTATQKYDGMCCKIVGGVLLKRREVKKGNPEPENFMFEQLDEITGKKVGWVSTYPDDPSDKYFYEAFDADMPPDDGTYELVGPKVQGNPESLPVHQLIAHATAFQYDNVPVDIDLLQQWLIGKDIEGLVWHHPDGRMAKIKLKDFGIKREPS